MSDLIKRIYDALGKFGITTEEWDLLADCLAEIERLSKPYVPMTQQERVKWLSSDYGNLTMLEKMEQDVIKRYNEQRGVK